MEKKILDKEEAVSEEEIKVSLDGLGLIWLSQC
jgi:hypothetical protein